MPASQPSQYRTAETQRTLNTAKLFIVQYNQTLYHFAGYDSDITVLGLPEAKGTNPQVFKASGADDNGLDNSSDEPSQDVVVTAPLVQGTLSAALRQELLRFTVKRISVWCYRCTTNNLPLVTFGEDMWLRFFGYVTSISFSGGLIRLQCKPAGSTESDRVATLVWSRPCHHILYGTGCNVVAEADAFRIATTLSLASRPGKIVEVADTLLNGVAIEQHVFQGGKLVEFEDSGYATEVCRLGIVATEILAGSAGVRLYLSGWSPTLNAGSYVKIYRGCRRTIADCTDVFDNLANFGGFPFIPVENPSVDGI